MFRLRIRVELVNGEQRTLEQYSAEMTAIRGSEVLAAVRALVVGFGFVRDET